MSVSRPDHSAAGVRLYDEPDWRWRDAGPSAAAVRAFGVDAESLDPMPGGGGRCWTDGRLVLKPVGQVREHDWICSLYAAWDRSTVRVPDPVHPADGDHWSVDGWGAHLLLPGRDLDLTSELDRVREAGEAFHEQVRNVARPDFLDVRTDPWAFGDRMAWGEAEPPDDPETLVEIERLLDVVRPVGQSLQPIHGDLLPNILVDEDEPLAVIDWPVYYRPAGFGLAIAATDAVTFRGAPATLLDEWQTDEAWPQLLVRALLYRLGATGVIASRDRLMGSLVTHLERARPVVDEVLRRCS